MSWLVQMTNAKTKNALVIHVNAHPQCVVSVAQ